MNILKYLYSQWNNDICVTQFGKSKSPDSMYNAHKFFASYAVKPVGSWVTICPCTSSSSGCFYYITFRVSRSTGCRLTIFVVVVDA